MLLLSKLSGVNGLPRTLIPQLCERLIRWQPRCRLALVSKDGANVDVETLGQYLDTNIVEPLLVLRALRRLITTAVAAVNTRANRP